jgi:hypothetical protein
MRSLPPGQSEQPSVKCAVRASLSEAPQAAPSCALLQRGHSPLMPGDGGRALSPLNGEPDLRSLPVVPLSRNASGAEIAQVYTCHANWCIDKLVSATDLTADARGCVGVVDGCQLPCGAPEYLPCIPQQVLSLNVRVRLQDARRPISDALHQLPNARVAALASPTSTHADRVSCNARPAFGFNYLRQNARQKLRHL